MEDALLDCLQGADDAMKINVLKAGSTLSESGDARFTLAALNLSQDSNAEVRQTVRYVYEGGQRGVLNLDSPNRARSGAGRQGCRDSAAWKPGQPGGRSSVACGAARRNHPWEQQASVEGALRSMLEASPRPTNYGQVLDAASSFSALIREPELEKQVLAGLNSPDTDTARAAVRICFEHFLKNPQSAETTKSAFANLNDSALQVFMEEAGNPQFLKRRLGVSGGAVSQDQDYLNRHAAVLKIKEPLEYPIVVDTVWRPFDSDANVSAAALDTLRKVKGVEKRDDFLRGHEAAQNSYQSPAQAHRGNVLKGKNLSEALKDVQPGSVLDFRTFVTTIEPILAKPGPDGKACVYLPRQPCDFQTAAAQCGGHVLRSG